MFTTPNKDLVSSNVPDYDNYSIRKLIGLLDDPNLTLKKEGDSVIDHIAFFIRTVSGNKIVIHTDSKGAKSLMFEPNIPNIPEGVTANDYMLYTAKVLLSDLYSSKYSATDIVSNAIPTPFGLIRRADNSIEALFQIVVNSDNLANLADSYEYKDIDYLNGNSHYATLYNQFKRTKD